jgi:hypothetical protein
MKKSPILLLGRFAGAAAIARVERVETLVAD